VTDEFIPLRSCDGPTRFGLHSSVTIAPFRPVRVAEDSHEFDGAHGYERLIEMVKALGSGTSGQ
jgi:hypothetical protein